MSNQTSNWPATSNHKPSGLAAENLALAFFKQARAVIQPMEAVNVMESLKVVLPSLFTWG